MEQLEAICEEIMAAPTIMDLSLELHFCQRLLQLDRIELQERWDLVTKVFERLHESHTQTLYQVTSKDQFAFFVTWAEELALSPEFKSRVDDLASIVSTLTCLPA